MYKEPKLNAKGLPVCEICQVGYSRLMQHVKLRHDINPQEYKFQYGLDPKKGVQSKLLKNKMRKQALKNYNKVIMENLIIGGQGTRFKIGNKITDKKKVSIQSSIRMQAKWTQSKAKEIKTKEELITSLTEKMISTLT